MKEKKVSTAWIVAEELKDFTFRIVKVIQPVEEPDEEFRKAIVEVIESYREVKLPDTVVILFTLIYEEDSELLLAQTEPDQIQHLFETLKLSRRMAVYDFVRLHWSAWYYLNNMDVLEYSHQHGSERKHKAMLKKNSYVVFHRENRE